MPAGLECEQASRTIHTIVVSGATDDLTLDEIGLTTGDLGEVMGLTQEQPMSRSGYLIERRGETRRLALELHNPKLCRCMEKKP
jgi:hypothetical protein